MARRDVGETTRVLTAVDFDALRRQEFARLDEAGEIYLDYTGSAIPAASLVAAHHQQIDRRILGNPVVAHSLDDLLLARRVDN